MESSGMSFARVLRSSRRDGPSGQPCAPSRHTRQIPARVASRQIVIGHARKAAMRHLMPIAIILCMVCSAGVAQQNQSGSVPNAPSASGQTQTTPQGTNPLQSSVVFFQLLQRKSVFFPDLATNAGPLDRWQKFKLAANNSVSLATISAALLGSAYG